MKIEEQKIFLCGCIGRLILLRFPTHIEIIVDLRYKNWTLNSYYYYYYFALNKNNNYRKFNVMNKRSVFVWTSSIFSDFLK